MKDRCAHKNRDPSLEFPPDHFVDNARVGLDNFDHLGGDVLVHVVRDGDAVLAVAAKFHGRIHRLQQGFPVDAGDDEVALVQRLRTLSGGADADGRERMADGGEEAALLGQRAAIGHHCKGIHLQAVVVVKSEGLVLDDARIQLEAGGFQALAAAGVAAVEDGHVVLFCHTVDGVEEREEVLLRVDVFLAVGAQKDILALLQAEPFVDVTCLDLGQVLVQHLGHRRAGHVSAFLRQTAVGQIAAGVLAVGHVDVRNDIHDAAIGLLRQALVLAAVAGLHVENGDMQALSADDAEAGVGVAQHQHGVGLHLHHQLVALGDDVAHRFAQVLPYRIHIHVRIGEFEVLEKDAIEVVVVVLPGVRQQAVEIRAAFVDDRRQTDDLRARADNDQKLQLPVILELVHNTYPAYPG